MKALTKLGIVVGAAICLASARGQEIAKPAGNTVGTKGSVSASPTDQATTLVSGIRGVAPGAVKITASPGPDGGPFEIDLVGAKDWRHEALELSKVLGDAAAVIVDQVSDNGVIRTNWTFKAGTIRELTAPVGRTGLKARSLRMYVWPLAQANPPSGLRVRGARNRDLEQGGTHEKSGKL